MLLFSMAALSVAAGAKNAVRFSQDLQYDAAAALMMGYDPYEVSLSEDAVIREGRLLDFYRHFEEAGAPQRMEANQFPSLLILLFPIAALPFPAAKYVWLILNLIFTGIILMELKRTWFKSLSGFEFAAAGALMIAGTPWRNQIGVGQHTLFSLCFFLLAWDLSEREHPYLSGMCLAVSYFKYTLTAPLALLFIYRRRWKEFFLSLLPHLLLTIWAAVYLDRPFIYMIRQPLKVAGALAGEGSIDIGAVTSSALASIVGAAAVMLALLIAALKLGDGMEEEFFVLLLFCSLVMTYHRSYDFFVLTVPYAVFRNREDGKGVTGSILFYSYAAMVIFAFFGLRLFSENRPSLIVFGIMYYWVLFADVMRIYQNSKFHENCKLHENCK